MKHCQHCGQFMEAGRADKTYCGPSCRAGASRRRRNPSTPRRGEPTHGHDVTLEGLSEDGWHWLYGCKDCPNVWRGPLEVEDLEDVDCEAESQGRAA